jgi:aspartyl-tRNA synthetase
VGKEVVLMGWVQRRRDHGGVIFIDLRDREGITQVVFNPEINAGGPCQGPRHPQRIRPRGPRHVEPRPDGMINPNLVTGEIEVLVDELRIFNPAKTPPFMIEDKIDVSETIRLQHRHIDLRARTCSATSSPGTRPARPCALLNDNGFLDIETPVLTRSTPKGPGTTWCPAASTPASSTPCPSRPSCSSSCS